MKSGWKSACVANMYIDVKTMLTHFIADYAKAVGMKGGRKKMIEVGYLVDSKGAQKFGTCASCGKGSDDDQKMVRITYSHHDSISRTSNCLCADCRRLLLKTISDVLDRSVGEWIPVSERLPERGKEVLVCYDFKGHRSALIGTLYEDGKFYGYDDEYLTPEGRRHRRAVAWMPLPEPYRGGDTE